MNNDPWGEEPKRGQKKVYNGGKLFDFNDQNFKKFFNNGFNFKKVSLGLAGALLFWIVSGFYTVQPDEEGLELIFGKYRVATGPGLQYNLPSPIGKVVKVKVAAINKEEVGYKGNTRSSQIESGEGIMLTGDENIVNVNMEILWKVKSAYDYLFQVREISHGNTIKNAAESALRESIGQNTMSFILKGEGRAKISEQTRTTLQSILDSYAMGVEILSVQMKKVDPPEKVINAFRDVQSARSDKEREINQAEAYSNDKLPRAKGEAQQIILQSEAYREQLLNAAYGEAKRFELIYDQYRRSDKVMKKRMHFETLENVLKSVDKLIISGNNTQSYIPLSELMKNGMTGNRK